MANVGSLLRFLTVRSLRLRSLPGSALTLALVWLGGTLLLALITALLPFPVFDVPGSFAWLGLTVLGGLLVSRLLDRQVDALRFAVAFSLAGLVAMLLQDIATTYPQYAAWLPAIVGIVVTAWAVAVTARLVIAAGEGISALRRLSALSVTLLVMFIGIHGAGLHDRAMIAYYSERASEDYREIDEESLWTAQPRLVEAAIEQRGDGGVHVIGIAAGGVQDLFGREAGAASAMLQRRFAGEGDPIVLSNAWDDLEKLPLANRSNVAAVLAGIGEDFDPAGDLAVIYLTAHGGGDATLQTDLPDYTQLQAISASFLAKALNEAGISRRVIIVSACFAGAWIEPLASPDTIILAAARADRTSFGCDDRREFTFYGEALLASGLGEGGSLATAEAALEEAIAEAEAERGLEPSLPQVSVGAKMRELWEASQPTKIGEGGDNP